MTDPEITDADRELLAEEYERDGFTAAAEMVRRGRSNPSVLRAIARARTEASRVPEVGGDAVEALLDERYNGNNWRMGQSDYYISRTIENAQRELAAADAARGLSWVTWRRPEEWVPATSRTERYVWTWYWHANKALGKVLILWWAKEGEGISDAIAWAEMPVPPAWAGGEKAEARVPVDRVERTPFKFDHHPDDLVTQGPHDDLRSHAQDLSRCGIQDGCDQRDRCRADGVCQATGSLLSDISRRLDLATARCERPGGCDVRGVCLATGKCAATGTALAGTVAWTKEKEAVLLMLVEREMISDYSHRKLEPLMRAAFPEPPR